MGKAEVIFQRGRFPRKQFTSRAIVPVTGVRRGENHKHWKCDSVGTDARHRLLSAGSVRFICGKGVGLSSERLTAACPRRCSPERRN